MGLRVGNCMQPAAGDPRAPEGFNSLHLSISARGTSSRSAPRPPSCVCRTPLHEPQTAYPHSPAPPSPAFLAIDAMTLVPTASPAPPPCPPHVRSCHSCKSGGRGQQKATPCIVSLSHVHRTDTNHVRTTRSLQYKPSPLSPAHPPAQPPPGSAYNGSPTPHGPYATRPPPSFLRSLLIAPPQHLRPGPTRQPRCVPPGSACGGSPTPHGPETYPALPASGCAGAPRTKALSAALQPCSTFPCCRCKSR